MDLGRTAGLLVGVLPTERSGGAGHHDLHDHIYEPGREVRAGFEVQCWGDQCGGDAEFEWARAGRDGGADEVCVGPRAADFTLSSLKE